MKILTLVLSLGLLLAALACAAPVPTPIPTPTPVPTATPDIPATVTARVAALPTATPYPTLTPWPTATPRPTHTPYPTSTPYPTATPRPTLIPDIRYQVVTPTPEPTLGPLANWVTHSFRSVSISLPFEFTGGSISEEPYGYWFTEYTAANTASIILVEGLVNSESYFDLYGMSDFWSDTTGDSYTAMEVLRFEQVSDNVLLGSYRVSHDDPQYCDGQYKVLFIRGDTHSYAVAVFWCDRIGWKYGEDFADRVLNSFTY